MKLLSIAATICIALSQAAVGQNNETVARGTVTPGATPAAPQDLVTARYVFRRFSTIRSVFRVPATIIASMDLTDTNRIATTIHTMELGFAPMGTVA